MRTLFISDILPHPLDHARRQRVYHLLRAVARVSRTTLVCFLENEGERRVLESFREFCEDVYAIEPKEWGPGRIMRFPKPLLLAKSLLDYCHPTKPTLLKWYESNSGKQLITRLCERDYDLVWAGKLASICLLPPDVKMRVLVDLDDLEHRKLAYRLKHAPFYPFAALDVLDLLKLRRFYRSLSHLPYELVVCSESDKRALGRSSRIHVVPNGVDLQTLSSVTVSVSDRPSFLFIGTMNYAPNEDAVQFFARMVFPLIRREIPEAQFLIVGRDPRPKVRKLHDGQSVVVTGTVSEVSSYLHRASVVVVPIRFGGGTRIKILEAMAHRKAIVSTTVGAEGIEAQAEKHLLLADNPEEFAASCVRLARDSALRMRLGEQGHQLVHDRYRWNEIECEVERIVANRSATSSPQLVPISGEKQ